MRAKSQDHLADIKWRRGAHLPCYVKGGAIGAVGGLAVYAAGVTQPWRETEMVWAYDPAGDFWQPLPPMPAGRAYTVGASDGQALYVVGGRWRGGSCAEVFRLRLLNGRWLWEKVPPLRQARAVCAAAVVNGMLVCLGGGHWSSESPGAFFPREIGSVELLDLSHPEKGWAAGKPLPGSPRAGAAACAVGDSMVVAGGYDCWLEEGQRRLKALADAWRYDVKSDSWSALPQLPAATSGAAAVALRSGIAILLGGAVAEGDSWLTSACVDAKRGVVVGEYSAGVWCLDAGADSSAPRPGAALRRAGWRRLPSPLIEGLNDLRACVVNGLVVAAGGENIDPTLSNTTNACQVGEPVWA